MILHFMYHHLIYVLVPILACAAIYRFIFSKSPVYTFPLISTLAKKRLTCGTFHKKVFFVLRLSTLLGLIFLIARPVWVDEHSKVNVNGVDIVLAIDVSDSMQLFDNLKDRLPRIDVAKQEALRFIEKRPDDPIGLVVFGQEAASLCPLTLDKSILKELAGSLTIGTINPQGTWLGTGLATAVNRLRKSQAKSKIIILLTDGEPTAGEKITPDAAIDLAKNYGIKVYTIGIGNEQGGYFIHPFFGLQQVPNPLNIPLLQKIASQTGGIFLKAGNQKELRTAYETIDKLEKTVYQTSLFHKYYEAFFTYIWFIVGLMALEYILRLFIWRGV